MSFVVGAGLLFGLSMVVGDWLVSEGRQDC